MSKIELIAPCHFGLEAVLKREITDLGYEITSVEDGKVTFLGEEDAIARANLFLRTAERILMKVGSFSAESFDELFEATKSLEWERYIPIDGKFWVKKAASVKSKLFSPSDIQSIVKKAIVERLKQTYRVSWFSESGAEYPIRVSIMKNQVTIALDTSGESLHKRGYRKFTVTAPLSETLAAALIMLTPWKADRILIDPFCGSGTIPIEAAMMGLGIAPGLEREFTAEAWSNIVPKKAWYQAAEEARDLFRPEVQLNIQGYDIDEKALEAARANAKLAGVEAQIHFQKRDVRELSHAKKYGFILTNPPYGERLEKDGDLKALYQEMGKAFARLDSWSWYLITGYEDAPKYIGRPADKNRKLYNGMLKTYFYQYLGPKPPRKPRESNED